MKSPEPFSEDENQITEKFCLFGISDSFILTNVLILIMFTNVEQLGSHHVKSNTKYKN